MTAIDTNVIVTLWDRDPDLNSAAQTALDSAFAEGGLVIAAPVFAELMAAPGRSEVFLDTFLRDTAILIDWELSEQIWRAAGAAFQRYSSRRRVKPMPGPRRILADFLIGAHASECGYRLLTLDDRLYRAAFPDLALAGL